jgi:hypothetical protein
MSPKVGQEMMNWLDRRKDKYATWGITTALQTLLMFQKDSYTIEDIMGVARMYSVEEDLLKRLSFVPETINETVEDFL